ncbi:MAG: helix-turn-helix domain-containing protein [Opitutus sp.]|nr:helix-turn-helix domain-containing protein [Opitutus sp.]MCS6246553.1 helix-turn-helix domain-containing protein [Opitutus sp.]MCS6272762.1 helix-turn-helix domain-containing protein [Opitutus sp.]MCS6276394.1 helix-turn-helix domain-containing protein [Opitutus sp.]MCS6301958.1 helix-turn-helix domain-containing protein [Opitutus sp.]
MTQPLVGTSLAERITYCAKILGNAAKLARAIGVSKPAVSKYLSGKNNPRRNVLSRIAHAAGVSESWLALGIGSPEQGDTEHSAGSSVIKTVHDLVHQLGGLESAVAILTKAASSGNRRSVNSGKLAPVEFTQRFNSTIADQGGRELFLEKSRFDPKRLDEICAGAVPSIDEFKTLINHRVLSLDWLIAGDGEWQTLPKHRAYLLNMLKANMAEADKMRSVPFTGGTRSSNYPNGPAHASDSDVIKLWGKIYERLDPTYYNVEVIADESMSPLLSTGDIVLIDTLKNKISSGTYFIRTTNGNLFVNAANTGSRLVANYLANKDSSFEIRQDQSLGRVVWIWKKIP